MLSKADFLHQTQAGSWAAPRAKLLPGMRTVPRLRREHIPLTGASAAHVKQPTYVVESRETGSHTSSYNSRWSTGQKNVICSTPRRLSSDTEAPFLKKINEKKLGLLKMCFQKNNWKCISEYLLVLLYSQRVIWGCIFFYYSPMSLSSILWAKSKRLQNLKNQTFHLRD